MLLGEGNVEKQKMFFILVYCYIELCEKSEDFILNYFNGSDGGYENEG